jgi:hypothetical protein
MYHHFPILWPSKIYPNWDFGFENKPSGNLVPRPFFLIVLQPFFILFFLLDPLVEQIVS